MELFPVSLYNYITHVAIVLREKLMKLQVGSFLSFFFFFLSLNMDFLGPVH